MTYSIEVVRIDRRLRLRRYGWRIYGLGLHPEASGWEFTRLRRETAVAEALTRIRQEQP